MRPKRDVGDGGGEGVHWLIEIITKGEVCEGEGKVGEGFIEGFPELEVGDGVGKGTEGAVVFGGEREVGGSGGEVLFSDFCFALAFYHMNCVRGMPPNCNTC